MDSRINEIVKVYIENFHLNDDEGFTDQDVDNFLWTINGKVPSFDYETGASKFVIIPEGEDFVIKIPFTGCYEDCKCSYDEEKQEWLPPEYEYMSFYGASDETGADYCAAECNIYEEAEEEGFEQLFLKIEKVTECDGIGIYIQPKAQSFSRTYNHGWYASNKSKEAVRKAIENKPFDYEPGFTINSFPVDWTASCLDVLGSLDELNRFFQFLTDNSGDLHENNIGYYNGKPCIIDYGNFDD